MNVSIVLKTTRSIFISVTGMYRCWEALFIIISLRFTTAITYSVYQQQDDCPKKCHCEETKVNCTDLIPFALSRNIKEVIIFNPTNETLVPRAFCGVLWPDVRKLTIETNVYAIKQPKLDLVDNLFNCLERLETLKIQGENQPLHWHSHTFAGLDSVTLVDLTGCSRIRSGELYTAISVKAILPKLSRIILAEVGNYWGRFDLTQKLTRVLGYKNITDINISSTTLSIQVHDLSFLCNSVTKLNISNVRILHIDSKFNFDVPCNSLRTIDVSGAHFWKTRTLPKHIQIENGNFRVPPIPVFESITTLFASSLVSPDHVISIINCSVTMDDKSVLTEVHLTGYNIPHFDLNVTGIDLIYADLSSNSMETIGQQVSANLKKIMKLDLSNNRLSKCYSFDETFNVLFRNNTELETLNLANNGLIKLPKGCFTGNRKLKYIDLSNNAFEKITFDIAHMSRLTSLDLKNNEIDYLDETTMDTLDHLYEQKHVENHTRDENQTLFVNLLGNPLKCHCAALGFVEWFIRTPVFATTRRLYHCEVDGRHVAMNEDAVAEAKEDCERPIRRRRVIILCSTIPTVCITIAVIVTYLVFNRRRKRLAYKQFEDTVKLIRDGNFRFEFPVFLSYSSENHPFVVNHILEPLQVGGNMLALFSSL